MGNPQETRDAPAKIKSASSAAYPLQLVVLLVVFAIASALYIYLTSGDEEGSGSIRTPAAPMLERSA
jgi:flagellar basal body-associated protein FliL